MFLFDSIKDDCCGCKICASVCPTRCITFGEDEETYVYPVREITKCIGCHLCEQVCPIASEVIWHEPLNFKVGIHKSDDIRYHSSSGGAFSAICEVLIQQKYIIYGVKLDNDLKCVFGKSNDTEGYKVFRKSKYIQADSEGVYLEVQNDLLEGKKVLFSGLPCQNAALQLFLINTHTPIDGLFTIDILCHGVVSQKIFDNYICELGNKRGARVVDFIFRNKHKVKGSVNTRSVEVIFNDGTTEYYGIGDTPFLRGYYTRLFYRPSCYKCKYANIKRVGDLTLADAWGIEEIYPDLDSLKGVSLILANTEKGERELCEIASYRMQLKDITLDWAINCNDTLREPTHIHPKRLKFFEKWHNKGFERTVNMYAFPPLYRRIYNRIIRLLKSLIK